MFKFKLGEAVHITRSGESGVIHGRSEYSEGMGSPRYWLLYTAPDGKATDDWFLESELSPIEETGR